MSETYENEPVEEENEGEGIEELSDEDMENVAGGWNGDDGGG